MVNIKEIPAEAGLIVRGANGWKVMRSVKARSVEIPSSALMSMIFARERSNFQHKRRDRLFEYDRWKRKKQFSRELGQNLADALRHKDEYFEAKEEFEYLTSTLKESIREALGIETSYPTWELNKLLRMIKQKAGQN
jgi:hypothetical protein